MKPSRILIVEDEAILAAHLALDLTQMGYEVAGQCATGETAVQQALKEKPDAILMDIRLRGGVTGIQAAEAIRKAADIPIIFLTAYTEENILQQAKNTDAYAFLSKPVRERELRASLEMALYKHAAESQRRQAEESVRALAARHAALLAAVPEIVMEVDQNKVYTWANRAGLEFFGQDVIGKEAAFYFEGEQNVYETVRPLFEGDDHTIYIESFQRRIDGEKRLLAWRCRTLKDGRGNVTGALSSARDITEEKQAALTLNQREKRLREILDNFQDAYLRADMNGRFVLLSPSAPRIFGYDSVEEMMGLPAAALYANTAEWGSVLDEIRRNGFVRDRVGRSMRKDGTIFWVSLNAQFYFDDQGRIEGTEGVARDITERESAEEALQESELKFRNVFQSSRDAIVVSRNGLHVFENQAYLRLYGYETPEELKGRPILDFVAASHRDQIAGYIRRRNAGETAPTFYESRGLRKDGSEFDNEIQASTFDLHGQIHILAVIRNITERKKTEDHLSQSFRELGEAFRSAIRALSSAIEMRDPYTSGHQERVTRLAVAIARKLGLDEDKVEGIRIAGTVHDIGKLSIPAEILSKPTKLSPVEYSLIQSHSQSGSDILENIPFPWPIARIVLQHHERQDGSGYPNKLAGEAILIEARIIAVADVVEAMSSHRPYRPALGPRAAIDEIRMGKGAKYDPAVVDACVQIISEPGFSFD